MSIPNGATDVLCTISRCTLLGKKSDTSATHIRPAPTSYYLNTPGLLEGSMNIVVILYRPHKPKHYEDMLISAQLPGHQASDDEDCRPSKVAATDNEISNRYKSLLCSPHKPKPRSACFKPVTLASGHGTLWA